MPRFSNNRHSSETICLGPAPTRGRLKNPNFFIVQRPSSSLISSPSSSPTTSTTVPHSSHRPAHLRRSRPAFRRLHHTAPPFSDDQRSSAPPSRTAPSVSHTSEAQLPPSCTPLTLQAIVSSPAPQRRNFFFFLDQPPPSLHRQEAVHCHRSRCVFFEQPSPTSTAILFSLPAPPLHAPRGGSSGAAAIASIQSPAPCVHVLPLLFDCGYD
ncbi:hypothetical protein DEO72_LG9g1604 [Vigna unguiculata]|uniref:Uncharacterized protein n=1 Tax=Vigna unguiculata TaxID=3917 RepID=A0A4D6MYI4_VIGUN|nr:hypothetical protein DEO72_LG9g1604 [Vigna unguiculata]